MSKSLLFGVLDWGLGHAARSVPLLQFFQNNGWIIHIAATGAPRKLLLDALPEAHFHTPPAYRIHYGQKDKFLLFNILKQVPRLLKTVDNEQHWVEERVLELGINLVISDNRYGFYSTRITSWMLTHQLAPTSGFGKLADKIVQKIHFTFLNKFNRCLVPDVAENPGIAGKLSHPSYLPPATSYLGLLSRFPSPTLELPTLEVLVLLSGPEPSRTIFEQQLLPALRSFNGRFLLVRGLPESTNNTENNVMNYADIPTLQTLIAKAALVICRSGYTSVMDLIRLQKKALLVPTPGQTEQEYLAVHLEAEGYFPYLRQADFSLEKALAKAAAFKYRPVTADFEQYKTVLTSLLNS